MTITSAIRPAGRWLAGIAGLAAVAYAAYAGYAWARYGAAGPAASPDDRDPLLDRFMPTYEIVERHRIHVDAPADLTFAAAKEMNLQQSPIVRAIFKGREWIMRGDPAPPAAPGAFIDQMRAIGWGMLAEVPGREVVMGAVTQPWMANVVFRPLPPEEFAAFHEPEFVKIVWTLRADPVGDRSRSSEPRPARSRPIRRPGPGFATTGRCCRPASSSSAGGHSARSRRTPSGGPASGDPRRSNR